MWKFCKRENSLKGDLMKIINPYYQIITPLNGEEILKSVESVARVCYKSEDKVTNDSSYRMCTNLIARGHEAMLEHINFSVKFVCDRGVSHELVRHRMASFAQESQRYCNYGKDKFGKEVTFIKPCFYDVGSKEFSIWEHACREAEKYYFELLKIGNRPEEARSVLPNSTKTEIIVTANLREWRHILKLRTAPNAHPQMRELMLPLLQELKTKIPIIFDDIMEK